MTWKNRAAEPAGISIANLPVVSPEVSLSNAMVGEGADHTEYVAPGVVGHVTSSRPPAPKVARAGTGTGDLGRS